MKENTSIIKIACFMLNFLNLKSKASHLFWEVASSLRKFCFKDLSCRVGIYDQKVNKSFENTASIDD
jgi:hypothetical protein